jgi:hypothetical protein
MRPAVSTILLLLLSSMAFSQASDFITVKKRNNRTLATYFPGSTIVCRTVFTDYVSGVIRSVHNDSVFIQQYDVRAVPNYWGLAKIDTLGSMLTGIYYKDIETVVLPRRESFTFIKNGTLFMVGGVGYALLNLINGQYLKQSITDKKNMQSLGIALGVAGAGLLMNRLYHYNNRNNRRYRVEYIHMQGPGRLRGF